MFLATWDSILIEDRIGYYLGLLLRVRVQLSVAIKMKCL